MSQGYEEHTPLVTAGPIIADGDGMAEVDTPQAEVTHSVAGQHHSAADTALPADESFDEASDKGKKTADGETEQFEIASEEEKEDVDLKVKRAAMLKAQKELEDAESKAQARKDKEKEEKEKKDHAEAQSSGGGVAATVTKPAELPPGMYLPKVRVKSDDSKDMQETMMQLMAQVHNLSKDLKDMQDRIKERDDTIDKLNAVSSPTGFTREFGKGAPQPVDRKITERPKKYTGNIHEFVPWQEKLKIFLESQDPRWRVILDQIEERSLKPMNEQGFAQVAVAADILDHMETFQVQLYQYLEPFTAGDAHKMVLANKSAKSFETWRMFTDKGRSRRPEHIHQLRKVVHHPVGTQKLADVEGLLATWEANRDHFERIAEEKMKEGDQVLVVIEMCPKDLKEHLEKEFVSPGSTLLKDLSSFSRCSFRSFGHISITTRT